MNVTRAIEARSARQREQQQAVARPARVRFQILTEGTGQKRLLGAEALRFNAWMLEEPTFSYGLVAQGPIQQDGLPIATATVLDWIMLDEEENTQRGDVWLGAALGFHVQSEQTDIHLMFTLTFEGYTMRSYIETN